MESSMYQVGDAVSVSSNVWGLITNIRQDGRPWAGRRTLVGELALPSPIVSIPETATSDKDAGRLEQHLALVRIEARESESLVPEDRILLEPVDGQGHLNMDEDRGSWPLTVTIWVPEDRFSQLWAAAGSDLTLRLRADLMGFDHRTPLRRKADYAHADLTNVRLHLGMGDFSVGHLEQYRRRHLRAAWSGLHYGRDSQTSRIIDELAQSAAATLSLRYSDEREELTRHVDDLISDARSTFRLPYNLVPDGTRNGWWLGRAEFDEVLKDYDDAKRKKLQADYDFFWKHFPLNVTIAQGEGEAGAGAAGLKANAEELESLAHRLLSRPGVHSPILEWALLDGLVHAECLGMAQYIHSNDTFLGQRVAATLKPKTGVGGFKLAGKQVLKGLGELVFEGIKLFATYAVASFVTNGDHQSTWVVTTGMTAVRWLRKSLLWKELGQVQQPGAELFKKMSAFYELFKRQDFNANLARDQLYQLTSEGAVFSPYVASLLDARIRREEK